MSEPNNIPIHAFSEEDNKTLLQRMGDQVILSLDQLDEEGNVTDKGLDHAEDSNGEDDDDTPIYEDSSEDTPEEDLETTALGALLSDEARARLNELQARMEGVNLWDEEYRAAAEEMATVLEDGLKNVPEDADKETVDQLAGIIEDLNKFLAADWSTLADKLPDDIEDDEDPDSESEIGMLATRATTYATTKKSTKPVDPKKSKQASEQIRVPKGQPLGGQWKDSPKAVADQLLVALEALQSRGGKLPNITRKAVSKTISEKSARKLKACVDEDGPGPCFWDAAKRGNGKGTSFVIDKNGNHKTVKPTPIPVAQARKMKPCKDEDGPGPCFWDAKKQGNGKGRSYVINARGEQVAVKNPSKPGLVKATPQQIAALEKKYGVKVPKNWTDVKVNLNGKGLIASGKGPDGKRQQLYTKEYAKSQAANKLKKLKATAAKAEAIKKATSGPIKSSTIAAIKLMYETGMKSKTALMLSGANLKQSGNGYILNFENEEKKVTWTINDPELVKYLKSRAKSKSLFAAVTINGETTEKMISEELHKIAEGVTPDDMRLLAANEWAAVKVKEKLASLPLSDDEYDTVEDEIVTFVAARLGVTPEQARNSYISPVIFAPLQEGVDDGTGTEAAPESDGKADQ